MNYSVALQTLRKAVACHSGYDKVIFALECLQDIKEADRDARLFAVWCARQVQHLIEDMRSIKALEVAEMFANGEASREELDCAYTHASAASAAARDAASAAARDAARAARAAARAACAARDASAASAACAARAAACAARDACAAAAACAYDAAPAYAAAYKAQEEMLLLMLENKAPWQV